MLLFKAAEVLVKMIICGIADLHIHACVIAEVAEEIDESGMESCACGVGLSGAADFIFCDIDSDHTHIAEREGIAFRGFHGMAAILFGEVFYFAFELCFISELCIEFNIYSHKDILFSDNISST